MPATISATNTQADAASDFTPVALVAEQPLIMISRKDFPASTLAEFVAFAKSNQNRMQYGSPGPGTGSHLACALLNAAVGINTTHVPYRGLGLAMNDLLGGRIDYMCPTVSTALAQIEGRLVQAIAILTKGRSAILPDVASAHEQGITAFDAYSWNAIFLPKHVPAPIVRKLHDATMTAMNTPALQERLKELGATVVSPERRSSDYLRSFVVDEIAKWASPIKASGVSMD